MARPQLSIRGRFTVAAAALVLTLAASACSSGGSNTAPTTAFEPVSTVPATSSVTSSTAYATTVAATSITTTTTSTTSTAVSAQPPPLTLPPNVELADGPGSLRVPVSLPNGNPGDLIDVEDLGTFNNIEAYRILYHSRNRHNQPIAVSGFVAVPDGTPPPGGWPVLAYAHGTTGSADQCAPSAHLEEDLSTSGSITGLTLALVTNSGYAVVATDYEGLGTPGPHPYVIGESAANTVLDSVRAIKNMTQLQASNEWIVVGASQGGHAALHTGQRWQQYAPELDLLGVIAIAPPSQFKELFEFLTDSPARGYLLMMAAGVAGAYDGVEAADVLTDTGLELLGELENECVFDFFTRVNEYDLAEVLAVADPFEVEPWGEALVENDTNRTHIPAPLLIVHGGADQVIPADTSEKLLEQLCGFADQGPASRKLYPDASHGGVFVPAASGMLAWANDRFAGEPAPNDCS